MINNFYDRIIVGSSPLLIIEAIHHAQSGKSVCVLERNDALGGSWQSHLFRNNILIEEACHLVESIPDCYSTLEYYTGVEFVDLSPQPIRLINGKFILPYSNRILALIAGLRVLMVYFVSLLGKSLGLSLNEDQFYNFHIKANYFLSSQLECIFSKRSFPLKAPIIGYAAFVNALIDRAISYGVKFIKCDIASAEFSPSSSCWSLSTTCQQYFECNSISITSSTNLHSSSPHSLVSKPLKTRSRKTLLVSVDFDDVVIPHSYVAISFDNYISRISRLDFPSDLKKFFFLVEIKKDANVEILKSNLFRIFTRISLIRQTGAFVIESSRYFLYVSGSSQFKPDPRSCNLQVVNSFGNLSCGVLEWLRKQTFVND